MAMVKKERWNDSIGMNTALFEYTEAQRMKIWLLLNSSNMKDSSKCFSFQIWARCLYERQRKGEKLEIFSEHFFIMQTSRDKREIRQDVTVIQREFVWFPSKSSLYSFLTIFIYAFLMILLRFSTFSQSLFLRALVGHSLLTRVTIILLLFC